MITLTINPCSKPRMTQSDRWRRRPCVIRYREYCDEIALAGVKTLPERLRVVFGVPMPKSWSNKKRDRLRGQPHQQRPDIDNLIKAFLDAVYHHADDAHIYEIHACKVWADLGYIEYGNLD